MQKKTNKTDKLVPINNISLLKWLIVSKKPWFTGIYEGLSSGGMKKFNGMLIETGG